MNAGNGTGRTSRAVVTPPPVAFIAWSSVSGRSREISSALGGEFRCYFDFGITRRSLLPIRYLASAVRTVCYLVVRRPRAVILTNPPIFVALAAYPYARLARAPLLLDSHPDAFRTDGPHAPFLGLHRWLARRARATLVTTDELASRVESWGGAGVVVHEPPPARLVESPAPLGPRPRVLVLGTLSTDEPLDVVLAAARELPELDFELTGDARRVAAETLASVPPNVRFLGFLRGDEYAAEIERASVTVVLTTWLEWAVPRSAYDAVYGLRPLVVTGSPVLRELFPYAIAVENEPAAVASGIRDAVERHDELVRDAREACALQTARWEAQLSTLRSLLARH
jgi:glycosyltransferase involved in cell wall biosynthesis